MRQRAGPDPQNRLYGGGTQDRRNAQLQPLAQEGVSDLGHDFLVLNWEIWLTEGL
jgi:hypothetical protein